MESPAGTDTKDAHETNLVYIPKASAPALAFVLKAMTWKPNGDNGESTAAPQAVPRPEAADPTPHKNAKTMTKVLVPKQPEPESKAEAEAEADLDLETPTIKGKALPPAIELTSLVDSGTATLEEILDTASCYQLLDDVQPVLYASLVHHRWHPSIVFAVAVLTGRGNAQYYSQKLVGQGEVGLHPWAVRALDAHDAAILANHRTLFDRWQTAFSRFKVAAQSSMADKHYGFGKRCVHTCDVNAQYHGDFKKFHMTILDQIYDFATESPALMSSSYGLQRFCAKNLRCQFCAARIAASARLAWAQTMKHNDWSLEKQHGMHGPWKSGRALRARNRRDRAFFMCR